MPRSDTKPEMALRRSLHALGLRYKLHPKWLPGRPDVAFTRARIAVFVDGCFWHRCPHHGTLPKHNREWWTAKLNANVERDQRKDSELKALGWTILHVWEHEVPSEAADRIAAAWAVAIQRDGGPGVA